ncbi:hypothetical protein F7725_002053 [Dissostichus mawsoni]|uniref:Uncharacterized protein n=1 Tax=Dissostichus mawsoni TaxID=36200 RepID=A0A7J5Y1A9_DISMA|nr:hypothetical protein F7725_002053 [Dissostichus mawsoni]
MCAVSTAAQATIPPRLEKGPDPSSARVCRTKDETDDHKGNKGALQKQEASPQKVYRLFYNPSSYHPSVWTAASSRSQTDNDEDEQCLSTLAPSFWQQRNRYSVSCSRHLSSSKNTLLDLAFKDPEPERPSKTTPPDVKVNARAFLKCRPEYASMTIDLTKRPRLIEMEEALPLLQKVIVLKGSMKPSDVCQFIMELSRCTVTRYQWCGGTNASSCSSDIPWNTLASSLSCSFWRCSRRCVAGHALRPHYPRAL